LERNSLGKGVEMEGKRGLRKNTPLAKELTDVQIEGGGIDSRTRKRGSRTLGTSIISVYLEGFKREKVIDLTMGRRS